MSRKSFWNWLGLPSFADVQDLQMSARRQEEVLASLASINAEANKTLVAIQEDLSDAVNRINGANQNMLEAAKTNVCETIQAGIDLSRKLISEQMAGLAQEALSTIRTESDASVQQTRRENQEAVAGAEKRILDMIQTYMEKSKQLFTSHTQLLTEQALATAKAELTAALEQADEKIRVK